MKQKKLARFLDKVHKSTYIASRKTNILSAKHFRVTVYNGR